MTDMVYFGARKVKIWPERQLIQTLAEPTAHLTDFADYERYHERLIQKILALEQREDLRDWFFVGGCGVKIRHIHRWASIEADLIHARARELFRRVRRADHAVVDACWASIYRDGDYCIAHSHLRAQASVVYLLDPGEPNEADPVAGRFCFVDPRIAACCKVEAGHMTHVLTPDLRPGSMLLFPGHLVHSVNPYRGSRPRITLSWNINPEKLPGDPADDLR
jgi:Putative 2OG-Fe(II) oxygenase